MQVLVALLLGVLAGIVFGEWTTQIGFIGPLLEWVDECWPASDAERLDLERKLRSSLTDEAVYLRRKAPPAAPPSAMDTFR